MISTYLAGSLVRVATYAYSVAAASGGFRDSNGNPVDPTTVVLSYRPGVSASVITVTYPSFPISHDGVGLYHADLDTTGYSTDTWTYTWSGTGAAQAIAEGSFYVQADPL